MGCWLRCYVGQRTFLLSTLGSQTHTHKQRCTVHRVIPGSYKGPRSGIRTTVFGEKRESPCFMPAQKVMSLTAYFDPASESRAQRDSRVESEAVKSGDQGTGVVVNKSQAGTLG